MAAAAEGFTWKEMPSSRGTTVRKRSKRTRGRLKEAGMAARRLELEEGDGAGGH